MHSLLFLTMELRTAGDREGERAKLPGIEALPEADRLPCLRQKFEELDISGHPLRIALDMLQTLDTIRIIEGKA